MIQLIDVRKSFRGQTVLDGVNLHCLKGQITVLIGRSGTGKSVTLKHIIGLVKPDEGSVLIDGSDITKLPPFELNEQRRRFGMLFQDGALFDSMSVGENVAFPLREARRMTKDEITAKVQAALAEVGLVGVERKMPSELSGGMRKRAALARAIVMAPAIMLYDEPTTGLDPIMTDSINRLIKSTHDHLGHTVFIISHDIDAAMRIADQLAVLHAGKVLAAGSPDEIRNSEHPFIRAFVSGQHGEAFEDSA